jgi:hypothetical protein
MERVDQDNQSADEARPQAAAVRGIDDGSEQKWEWVGDGKVLPPQDIEGNGQGSREEGATHLRSDAGPVRA